MIADDDLDLVVGEFDKNSPADDLSLWRRWERLRVVYNAVLLGEVILFVLIFGIEGPIRSFLRFLVQDAILANLCFSAGPVLEGYFRLLKFRKTLVTKTLFFSGLFVSIGITGISLMIRRFPPFD